jgi:hypothetical protein
MGLGLAFGIGMTLGLGIAMGLAKMFHEGFQGVFCAQDQWAHAGVVIHSKLFPIAYCFTSANLESEEAQFVSESNFEERIVLNLSFLEEVSYLLEHNLVKFVRRTSE